MRFAESFASAVASKRELAGVKRARLGAASRCHFVKQQLPGSSGREVREFKWDYSVTRTLQKSAAGSVR